MRIVEYCPEMASVARRKSIRFGKSDAPPPVAGNALPFKRGCVAEAVEVAVGTYRAPVVMTANKQIFTTVRIFNLPLTLAKRDLESFLAHNTRVAVLSFVFVTDKEKKTFKGSAFCGFADMDAANAFIKNIDGKVIENYKIGAVLVKR